MTRRTPLPDALVGTPFTRSEARAAGVADRRMRARDIHSPFYGVHIDDSVTATVENRCHAYETRMSRPHAFSHVTAAQLYGLPLPLYATANDDVHVSVPGGARQPRGRGVAGHAIAAERWAFRRLLVRDYLTGDTFELCVVEPAIVWAQLAEVLDHDDLVALGDAIVTGEMTPDGTEVVMSPGLATISEVEAVERAWAGMRGSRLRARAVRQVRVGSLSRTESLLRLMVVRAGIPEPLLNVMVCAPDGSPVRVADLVWREERVLTEYEGDDHRTSRGKFRGDISKFEEYADGEWHGLRAHADDLFVDPNPLIARLWRRLVARGWRPDGARRPVKPARR